MLSNGFSKDYAIANSYSLTRHHLSEPNQDNSEKLWKRSGDISRLTDLLETWLNCVFLPREKNSETRLVHRFPYITVSSVWPEDWCGEIGRAHV